MKILVLGDGFIDRNWLGTSTRMSAEAPIPVVDMKYRPIDQPGGALNVRENLISLGVDGQYLFPPENRTHFPIKNRLFIGDTQVARWDEEDWCIPYQREDMLVLMDGWDGVIVSDYGKGSITEEVIQILRQLRLPVFVDTKTNPNGWLGSEVTLFPNLGEYKKFEQIYDWFPKVVLKKGVDGMALVEFGNAVLSRPSVARFVRNVNGAGDTAIAAFVIATLEGGNFDYCLEFANSAAAVAVEKPLTAQPTLEEALQRWMETRG